VQGAEKRREREGGEILGKFALMSLRGFMPELKALSSIRHDASTL